MATAAIVVNVSMGVMKPVLAKLAKLMGDEYKKLKLEGLWKEVSFLRRELHDMSALLEKMDDADELDPQAKNWRKDIIDMSYDIEDYIDDFMQHVGDADDRVGILRKASHYVRTIKDRHRLANKFQEIKTRVIEASECRKRYMLDQCISHTAPVVVDPRLSAIYNDSECFVGIDTQKEELVRWVMDEGQKLTVMSIVGCGGLGKTTLASEVYREVQGHFNCTAFVPVSRTPDIRRLLCDLLILLQLLPSPAPGEVKYLIDILRKYLDNKRYLIIVDDLWDVQAWKNISCAFPPNNHQSRVIVTTRQMDVARACCSNHGCIHSMEYLSESDSRKLFFKRISGSEDACHSQYSKLVCEILRKCGGLPLAIITVASILAHQPERLEELWESIQNYLAAHSAKDTNVENMLHILDLSYKSLPHHLKTCFLYLGKYPEDHTIIKSELVRQWVAEEFVSTSPGRDVWAIAEGYFNELLNRNMIHPIYGEWTTNVYACKVHDMMLDLILRRCRENNFVNVVCDPQEVTETQYMVRRLSINQIGAVDGSLLPVTTTSRISQIRSLTMFGVKSTWIPPLLQFKFIRVLFLEFYIPDVDLTYIIELSQLRHLKIVNPYGGAGLMQLPSQIRRLQNLETLELAFSQRSGWSLPSDVVDLPRLSYLILNWCTASLPEKIGKMKQLRTLCGFDLEMNSLENIKGLGQLTNLVDLRIWGKHGSGQQPCCGPTTDSETLMDALISALDKLSNLKRLFFSMCRGCCHGDALNSLSPTFCNIEWLGMRRVKFSRVPRWIGSLHNLRALHLQVDKISNSGWEDLGIIGALPSLITLTLTQYIPTERIVIAGSTGFRALQHFCFNSDGISYLKFEAGAMPSLWDLHLRFNPFVWDKGTPAGLEHLSSLKKITASRWAANPPEGTGEDVKTMTSALITDVFQKVVDALPTHPVLSTSRRMVWCYGLLPGPDLQAPPQREGARTPGGEPHQRWLGSAKKAGLDFREIPLSL